MRRARLARLSATSLDAFEIYGEVFERAAGARIDPHLEQRVAIRQATTYAIHEARDVVTTIYHEAGSTAIFDDQPFERRLRDINSVSQQLQGRRAHFETVGQHMLGLETNLRNV